MNEETTAKQNEYYMALFGVVRRESGKHPVINGDPKQEQMYIENMSQLAQFCSSADVSDSEILQFFSGSTMPFVNILVQLLYGLSFSHYSQEFTMEMGKHTRECMSKLLYTDDCRLVSFLLYDCKILIDDLISFQKQYSPNEEFPECNLCCFFNVAMQISNSYGSINSQSETYSSTGSHELYVMYDCSKGETRQSLLTNTTSFFCFLLSECYSSVLFTHSLLSYYSLATSLLTDFHTIHIALEVITCLINLQPHSLQSLHLLHTAVSSITQQIMTPSELGGSTAIAIISDSIFTSFIQVIIQCLQECSHNSSILYPYHFLYSTLSDFILHFPIQTRSSLIPSLLQLLSFLHSMDAVTDIFCKNWIIQCLSSLPLSDPSSIVTEATPQLYPISYQSSSSIILFIEECSKLLFEVINHDEQQFYLFLTVMNFISVDQEFTAKRVHHDYSLLSFEIQDSISYYSFYLLLLLYNKCIIHLNHNQQPWYSSSFIHFLQTFKTSLIHYIDHVFLPVQSLSTESTDSTIPSLFPSSSIQLCVALSICTSQLLEKEEKLRKRLQQYIEKWCILDPNQDSCTIQSNRLLNILYDGSKNELQIMYYCLHDMKKNEIQSLSLASLSKPDLLLLLLSFYPSLLNAEEKVSEEWIKQYSQSYLQLKSYTSINIFSTLPITIHSLLYHFQSFQHLSSLLSSFLQKGIQQQDFFSIQTLLINIQFFSCSLRKYMNFTSCYYCLHQDTHSTMGDFPNYIFHDSSNTCIDMNELYFTLFYSIHKLIVPFFSQYLQEKDNSSNQNQFFSILSLLSTYLLLLSSILQHSMRFLVFVINQQGDPLIRTIHHDQDEEETKQKIKNSWVYLSLGEIREFMHSFVLSTSPLYYQHSTSILLFLLSLVSIEVVFNEYIDDMSCSLLQYTEFKSLIRLVDSIESTLQSSKSIEEYNQYVIAYRGVLYSVLNVIYSLYLHTLLHPSLKSQLSLLIIQLFKWLNNNSENIIYDFCIQHLIRLSRYALIIHRKHLWVVLPECIVAEIVKSLISLPTEQQEAIVSSAFDPTISLSEWYDQLAIYVLPVYIYQQEIQSIITLAKAIHPHSSISFTISSLFQGDRCIYNVLVYLLKHMLNDSINAWTLFFFLQSDFTDQQLESFSLEVPSSSKISITHLIQQEGHRILWPLLFDCTDSVLHDRQMSETALKSLYDLYEENGKNQRVEIFAKSFHYFNFQINQALSFNMSELKRAIFALKRSLKDFKEFCNTNQTKLPDNFLWGVLSFIKSILQKPELQLHALILLNSFLDTLSETMLFRVLSEIIVCVAASFEQCKKWLQLSSQSHILFYHANMDIFHRIAIEREAKMNNNKKLTQDRTIDSYFSQKALQPSDIVMTIYGLEEEEIKNPNQSIKTWKELGNCCDSSTEVHMHDSLYSFDMNYEGIESFDSISYLQNTSAYFSETLNRINQQYPTQFKSLLQQRPYLSYLRFGDYSLTEMIHQDLPQSSQSFSVSEESLLSLFQLICNIPELSLEVIPALSYASLLLKYSQKTFQQWLIPLPVLPAIIQQFYYYCIHLTSIAISNQSKHLQLVLGEVLGLLGAIAPERFDSQIHENSIQPFVTDFDLALKMIKDYFVKDLMGLPKREIQNRIALTVQRLLRFLQKQLISCPIEELSVLPETRLKVSKIREEEKKEKEMEVEEGKEEEDDDGENVFPKQLKRLFTEEELSVISQYWKTEYAIRKEGSDRSQGFEGISVKNYAKWITKCSLRLIIHCPQDTPSTITCSNTTVSRSSTIEIDSTSSFTRLESLKNDDSVIYIFRTLLSPLCADRAAFLFPHIIQFALFYHYNHMNDHPDSSSSSSTTTPNTTQPIPTYFTVFANYCNEILHRYDISNDNEVQHCCSDLLLTFNTLEAWSRSYAILALKNPKSSYKTKSFILSSFLSLLDHRQIIRVAKILGQYERALKEMEEYIRSTHSVTTGILQDHITTVFNSINRNEVDELLMLYYKLQNHDMTNGYEVLLERNQGELSLFHQSRDLEMKYQYDIAIRKYREFIQMNQNQTEQAEVIEEASAGYYRCLQCSGNWKDVLTTPTQSAATLFHSSQLLYWKMEGCWRECDWILLKKEIEEFEWLWKNQHEKTAVEDHSSEKWLFHERELEDNQFEFTYYLSKLLLAQYENKPLEIKSLLKRSRISIIHSLSFHSSSSIQSNYSHLLHLHILQDIEASYNASQKELSSSTEFNKRLSNTSRSFEHRELLLACRKVIVEQTKQINQVNSLWMQIASIGLETKVFPAVWIALCHLQDSEGYSQVIRARLYDELGYTTNSINILHTNNNESKEVQLQKLENYVRIKRRVEPYDVSIQSDYKRLLELGSNKSDIHYNWGKLHDRIYTSQSSNTLDLVEAVRHYCLSLQASDSFLFHCVFRITTLWFRVMQEQRIDLMEEVSEIQSIQNYQWYTVLQQLVTVAQHPCDILKTQVSQIVKHILSQYTEHVVWQIIGLLNVSGSKKDFMMPIVRSHELDTKQKRSLLENAFQISKLLISLSTSESVNQKTILDINTRLLSHPLILPIQQYLHSGINSFSITNDMNIARLSTNVEIFASKERPKKIIFRNTYGKEYLFLCKQERKGDLRKDLRMMEYVSIINHILVSDNEGRLKHLQLNTFCVTCLNEKSGLIEWVHNSEPVLRKLNTLRSNHGLPSCSKTAVSLKADYERMQVYLKSGQIDIGLQFYFDSILTQCEPLLHEWLLNDFADPRQWLQARELFTQTTAMWSITGYISFLYPIVNDLNCDYMIGLGDRHNDNILIQKNGAVSHIDFDCIFEKGTILPIPERVPFRLTPNLVDAFGISGIEGTFRCTCEVVMRCMRSNHDLLISVLESLLYDPLMDWRTFYSDGNEKCGSDVFNGILKVIDNRLRGVYGERMIVKPSAQDKKQVDVEMINVGRHTELSVQGQVDNVIKDATNTYNLARMYIGWMPFM